MRTDRTLPSNVSSMCSLSGRHQHTEDRHPLADLGIFQGLVLLIEDFERHALSIDIVSQARVIFSQVFQLPQLLQPLLLLDIVAARVRIGGNGLGKPSLESTVGAGEFGLDGGLDAPGEVRSEEVEGRSAHTFMRVSVGTGTAGTRM